MQESVFYFFLNVTAPNLKSGQTYIMAIIWLLFMSKSNHAVLQLFQLS